MAGPPSILGWLSFSTCFASYGVLLPRLGTLSLRKASTLFPDLLTCCFLMGLIALQLYGLVPGSDSSGANKLRLEARKNSTCTYKHTLEPSVVRGNMKRHTL